MKKAISLLAFSTIAVLVTAQKLQPLSPALEAVQPTDIFPAHAETG